ncbi:hypothetical protein REC12_20455 [Desulfosporosinus sp. PR]|nr:hypothetical protein [Desulfosporosinus sp. PR]MDQ7095970.1 hypothetical protein [Desulfosporosinus sp. PR]
MSKYFVYHCDECNVKFAVDQEFEDQKFVSCPLCNSEEYLREAGEAVDV